MRQEEIIEVLKEKGSFIRTKEDWERFKNFIKDKETPFLVINPERVREKYRLIRENFPEAKIYYAVKANPVKEILEILKEEGSYFDIASIYELDLLLEIGVEPERISFGNTIKKRTHIEYAYKKGVRLFVTDSEEDVKNIAKYAPGSKVFSRILTTGIGADWPLSKKFGAHLDIVVDTLILAKKLGLIPYGVSFHVGSQQRDVGQWDEAIATARFIFNYMRDEEGIELKMLNIGGGLPARYTEPIPEDDLLIKEIRRFVFEDFEDLPEIIIEPGRFLVAEAGIIVSEVVLISKKNYIDPYNWVYLDIGKFGGLIETIDESIKFPIICEREGFPKRVILAGPTCDSMDILYEKSEYYLPEDLKIGDKVFILSTGAYTLTYSSVSFNGFPPLKYYIWEK